MKCSLNKLNMVIDRACLVEISIVKTPLGSQLPTSVLFNCWGKKPQSIPHNEGLLRLAPQMVLFEVSASSGIGLFEILTYKLWKAHEVTVRPNADGYLPNTATTGNIGGNQMLDDRGWCL